MTIPELMLMYGREATTNKIRTASPTAISYSRGKIAKQAAPVNVQDERRIRAAVDKCRLFRLWADKAVKPKSA